MAKQSRATVASACLAALDTDLFKALCEPSRLEVVRGMIKLGRADVSDVAKEVPLDRSVVSRHLRVLELVGIAVSHKEGRRVFYELDGPAIMHKFEKILMSLAPLVPLCCPSSEISD